MSDIDRTEPDANRDPITGTPGAHPIGTGTGAAGGAAAGAAIGSAVGGPVGLAVGGVAGAIAGGLAGKGVAEVANPTELADPVVEDSYWRANYTSRPYVGLGTMYDVYQPAYRYGWESRSRFNGSEWDSVEVDLSTGWGGARGASMLEWNDARLATRDAWDRVGEATR